MRENGKDTEIVDLCLLTRPHQDRGRKNSTPTCRDHPVGISHPKPAVRIAGWARKTLNPEGNQKLPERAEVRSFPG